METFRLLRSKYPAEIQPIKDGLFLITDHNRKLRLLNIFQKRVVPVCVGSTTSCATSTALVTCPFSFLIINETVHVGGYREILRLTGFFFDNGVVERAYRI